MHNIIVSHNIWDQKPGFSLSGTTCFSTAHRIRLPLIYCYLWSNCTLFCTVPVKNCPSLKPLCTPSENWDWQREICTPWCGREIGSLGSSAPLLGLLRYFQRFVPIFGRVLGSILICVGHQVSPTQTGMGEVRLLPGVSIPSSLAVYERLAQTPHTVKGDSLRNVTTLLPPQPSDFTGGLIIHIVWILIFWSRTRTLVLLSF